MKFNYNDLVKRLQAEVLTVTFRKVDGSERVMRCTLLPQYLPEQYREYAPLLTETAPTTISVWDVENSGWRSFVVSNVTNVA